MTERKPGGRTLTYSYRWLEGVPLRDGGDALQVNGVGVAVADDKGKIAFESAFATRLPVTLDHGAEIVACGRARWKIENESFNVLKNNGYHLAHHFGHGKQCLKRRFAALNLLAFAFHTVCDGVETLCQPARQATGNEDGCSNISEPSPPISSFLHRKASWTLSSPAKPHPFRIAAPPAVFLENLTQWKGI